MPHRDAPRLPVQSCFIDGDAIVTDGSGFAVFSASMPGDHNHAAVLCAFDLLELDGRDLRRGPLEERKQTLVI
jgi:ATP-dependent DNA ligase